MSYRQIYLFSILAVAQSVSSHDATPDEFPYQVSLQNGIFWNSSSPVEYHHSCVGTILNEKWILTSAHCLNYLEESKRFRHFGDQNPEDSFIVKAGKYRLDVYESTEQNSTVKKYFKHPKFSLNVQNYHPMYDIGLIKLSSPLKLNGHVAAAELPMANSEPSGECISSGWNSTIVTPVVQKVLTSILDYRSCNKLYQDIERKLPARKRLRAPTAEKNGKNLVLENNLCTKSLDTDGINDCNYGNGGPLITKREDGKVEVVGVRSWTYYYYCRRNEVPTVYAKVSSFVDWIAKTMAAN